MAEPIGIDSNALTYLIDSTEPGYDPANDEPRLAVERVAMLRIFFYADLDFWVSPTVKVEYNKILDEYRNIRHGRFTDFLLLDQPIEVDEDRLKARVCKLLANHSGETDCRVLAEVEALGLDTLLSFDSRFARRVQPLTRVKLTRPSDFWSSLGIASGASPVRRPVRANPLSQVTWWHM